MIDKIILSVDFMNIKKRIISHNINWGIFSYNFLVFYKSSTYIFNMEYDASNYSYIYLKKKQIENG